jgi:hypothetical protein
MPEPLIIPAARIVDPQSAPAGYIDTYNNHQAVLDHAGEKECPPEERVH